MTDEAGPGTLVGGRYELTEVLGRGGMGTVWLASDNVLRREVVVKEVRLPPTLTASEREVAVQRSLREARAAATISHPHVVTVYDVVRQDERPWIVMEYLPCRTLEQLVAEQGTLPPARVARIGLGLLKALQAAHEAGIQHRDVKPANVLVRGDDHAVLTDFGIATSQDDRSLTRSGMLVGAPGYIAPERARGETGGPPADLWSLGVTLFAAVEGRPLFDRGSALATLTAIVSEPVELPATVGVLRPALEGLLQRDPEQRVDADRAVTLLRTAVHRDPSGQGNRAPAPVETSTTAKPPRPAPGGDTATGSAPRAQPHRRRVAAMLAGLAAVVVLAVLLIYALQGRDRSDGHAGQARGGAGSSARASSQGSPARSDASPTPTPRHSATPSPATSGTVPDGFHRFRDPTGFSIAIPDGWQTSHQGRLLYVRDPHSSRYLMVDQSDHPKSDPVADWRRQETQRRDGWPQYHRIGIRRVSYFRKAADWEFTYAGDHGRVHVINRGVVTSPHQAYGLYWSVPDDEWQADQRYWKVFTATLHPAR